MGKGRLATTLDLSDSDGEEKDLYDILGQEVVDCEHVKGPNSSGESCHINEVSSVLLENTNNNYNYRCFQWI